MSRDSADDNQHLPPWLRGLPLPPRPPGMPEAPNSAFQAPSSGTFGGTGASEDQVPPWLSDISSSPPASAGNEEMPPWLAGLDSSTPTDSASGASSEEMPSWLQELSSQPLDAPESDSGSMPDWLRDLPPEDSSAPSSDSATPDWLRDLSSDTSTPSGSWQAPPSDTQEDLPDWLRAADSPSTSSSSDSSSEDLPDWLQESPATPNEPPVQPSTPFSPPAEDVPDWLRESAPPAQQPPAEDVPDWLRESAPPAQQPPAEDVPDWLRDAETTSSVPPSAPQPPAPQNDFSDTVNASLQPSTDDEDLADIPDWLRNIPTDEIRRVMESDDLEEDIALEPFTFEGAEPSTPPSEPQSDVPSWLSGLGEKETDQADSGPSWLNDLPGGPPQPPQASEAPDVPLWLQDLGAESSPPTQPSQPASDDSSLDDMPAWLRDAATDSSGSSAPAWLQNDAPTPPASDVPSWLTTDPPTTSAPSDIPAWLQVDQPPSTPAGPTADDAQIPSWLSAANEPSAPPQPPASSGSADSDLPPWLQEGPPSIPSEESASEELPSWLQVEPASPPPSPPSEPAVPDWLSEPSPISQAPATGEADDLPAWLREDAQVEPERPPVGRQDAPPPSPPTAPAADDLPPWLRDETGQPLPTAGEPGDANLPEWLRGVSYMPASSSQPSTEAPSSAGPIGADWFDEPSPTPTRTPESDNNFFGGAELPAWLRTTESEPQPEPNPTVSRSLDWLTKLGTQEEDTVVAAAPVAKLPPPVTPGRTPQQLAAIAMLDQLAATPYPEAVPLPEPPPQTLLQRIGLERILYVVLLIVLVAALAMPNLAANLQTPPESPQAAQLFEQISALGENDVVLLGYEWDARRISEMKPLEQAVIGQLIQQKVKLVMISTDPQGSLLLFDLRGDLDAAGYGRGAEDYIFLGYKPGGELALRQLVQDLEQVLRSDFQGNDATLGVLADGTKTGKPLKTIHDLSMIVVLADDAVDVQSWFEQIRRNTTQLPIAFLMPEEASPIVQPYLQQSRDTDQAPILHLAGKHGALAYEHLRGENHSPAVQVEREIGQERLGVLVFVLLLLIGGIATGVSEMVRRRAEA